MTKQHVELARKIRRELAEQNDGDVDLVMAKAIFVERVVVDVDALKSTAADSAFAELEFDKPRVPAGQLEMPGMPPDQEEFLNVGPNARAQACKSKIRHVMMAVQVMDEQLEKQQGRKLKFMKRVNPLMDYFAEGLSWTDASAAWRRDHPDAKTS